MAAAKKKAVTARAEEEARIEYVRLPDVKPALRNPKRHDIPTIVAAIRRWGFRAPPVENAATGRIVAGHGRKEAVEAIKAETPDQRPPGVKADADGEWMIPVVRGMSFASEREAESYLLADNRLVELGGWDNEKLAPILQRIAQDGAEAIAAIGWSELQIEKMVIGLGAGNADPAQITRASPAIIIECESEKQQVKLLRRFSTEGLKCRALM